jgi:hypothetical protein
MLNLSPASCSKLHTPGFAPVHQKSFMIGDGDLGTAQTIDHIRRLVHDGMTDQLVNRLAITIVRRSGVAQFDFVGEMWALYTWVLQNIRFVRDTFGVETLRSAREILQVQAGDCDDINGILLPSMLLAIGAHVRLVTISSDPQDPQTFSHIYCEVELPNGQWLPLDAARRDPAFGRGPRHYFRKRVWEILEKKYRDVSGLSGYFRSGMGDDLTGTVDDGSDGFDWSGLASVLGAGGTAAGNIIRAVTGQPVASTGFAINPATGQAVPVSVTPQGTFIATSVPGGVQTAAAGTIPTWMLFGALGLGAFLLMRQ